MKTKTVNGVEITADRLAAKLIDRLISTEKQLAAVRAECDELREIVAEHLPRVSVDGKTVTLLAMSNDLESTERFQVQACIESCAIVAD